MKRTITLSSPISRGEGITQNKFSIDQIHVRRGGFIIKTNQGNSVVLRKTSAYKKFVEDVEEKIKSILEGAEQPQILEPDPEAELSPSTPESP